MLVLAREATRLPETPKSHSFTSPFVLTRMLVGLTSTCQKSHFEIGGNAGCVGGDVYLGGLC